MSVTIRNIIEVLYSNNKSNPKTEKQNYVRVGGPRPSKVFR